MGWCVREGTATLPFMSPLEHVCLQACAPLSPICAPPPSLQYLGQLDVHLADAVALVVVLEEGEVLAAPGHLDGQKVWGASVRSGHDPSTLSPERREAMPRDPCLHGRALTWQVIFSASSAGAESLSVMAPLAIAAASSARVH